MFTFLLPTTLAFQQSCTVPVELQIDSFLIVSKVVKKVKPERDKIIRINGKKQKMIIYYFFGVF